MRLENTFAEQLEGLFTSWRPQQWAAPTLVFFNQPLAAELGLALESTSDDELAQLVSGNAVPDNAEPIAQAYAGHQFGHFNPQLGDGRAVLLGEILMPNQQRVDLSLKGAGRTPYARGGDGKAALGPMLREVLISEAMAALNIPTTRSLAVVTTGDEVYREQVLPGAVLARTAASHIRIGTFQYAAARGDLTLVKKLADYSIARHFPEVSDAENPYLGLLQAVMQRQAKLVAQWMSVGFIHGVMNTDNMSIAGETIDYGPCAFMEAYDPQTVFSSIDHQGRYAYQNQPGIAQWNLARLAEALLPLIDADEQQAVKLASDAVNGFGATYNNEWQQQMQRKLALTMQQSEQNSQLIQDWLALLQQQRADWTLAHRALADVLDGDADNLRRLLQEPNAADPWLARWQTQLTAEAKVVAQQLRQINPALIPRNLEVERVLTVASDEGDFAPFTALLQALRRPFETGVGEQAWYQPAPQAFTQHYQTFCGT